MQKILLAEDDPNLGEILKDYLEVKGKFDVILCRDGEEAYSEFSKHAIDICVFDVMMPKKDGFSLGKEIRKINPDVPIIFATAKGLMEDKMEAFGLGGDDYITKPFRVEELVMRIHALLKRSKKEKFEDMAVPDKFEIGSYQFDYLSQQISRADVQQKLSTKEAELLRMLCLKKNDVLTREEALLQIWNDDNYFNGRSMDVFLSKLRKYLREDPHVEIVNVHGKGYKLLVS